MIFYARLFGTWKNPKRGHVQLPSEKLIILILVHKHLMGQQTWAIWLFAPPQWTLLDFLKSSKSQNRSLMIKSFCNLGELMTDIAERYNENDKEIKLLEREFLFWRKGQWHEGKRQRWLHTCSRFRMVPQK